MESAQKRTLSIRLDHEGEQANPLAIIPLRLLLCRCNPHELAIRGLCHM